MINYEIIAGLLMSVTIWQISKYLFLRYKKERTLMKFINSATKEQLKNYISRIEKEIQTRGTIK